MQYAVRFDRSSTSSGPDAVLIEAERYSESYSEGRLAAYRFFDEQGRETAMVRAHQVVYIALAGTTVEAAPITAAVSAAVDDAVAGDDDDNALPAGAVTRKAAGSASSD